MQNLSFLYCFDENYNTQAFVAINSLLENIDEKININIIHRNPSSFHIEERKIANNEKVSKLKITKFATTDHHFPKLKNAHVSEATYYRIFAENYIEEDVDFLVYLDADIVCLNNPLPLLYETINKMKSEMKPIAARTEGSRTNYDDWTSQQAEAFFKRLDLEGENYFNAGVLVMNFKMWRKENSQKNLLNVMKKYKENIIYWDQDLLNKTFDNNFLEMDSGLNFNLGIHDNVNYSYEYVEKNISFLHFSGKGKPWNLESIHYRNSNFYQKAYRKISSKKYHIVSNSKIRNSSFLIKNLFNLRVLEYEYPLEFLLRGLSSLITFKK